jgi:aspartate carbamoyltransferase regulatory subunit
MFRNSILRNGQQYIRVGQAALTNISASQHKGKDSISSRLVSRTLKALQEKGAITMVGDTTHSGSMYKVNLPDEIQSCLEREKEQKIVDAQPVDENKELDYYNIAENRLKIFERDAYKCHYCNKQLTRFSATLDHIQPVSKGGDNSFENLITSCLHCNSQRGNRPVMDAILENENDS